MNATENRSTTRFLQRPEGRIAYETQGTGPVVLMIPGMGDIRSTFRFLAPAVAEAGFTAVTADLRGHGDSDTSFTSYGDEATADDTIALLEHLGRPAVLVGNSMGAAVSVIVAARRPELVQGLAMIGPWARDPQNRSGLALLLFRAMLAPAWARPVWNSYLPSLYKGTKPVDFDAYRTDLSAALKRPGHAKAFSQTTHTTHTLSGELIASVHKPALVVMGALDPDWPDAPAEAAWVAGQLGAETLIVDDAGHYPHTQRPEVVHPAIVSFLHGLHLGA
ncbi:alpha/beta fold hydrolase [Frondihabitans australicus]|uniref:Pimeloyl-ACP methyl ester carboxylesterase n=1 Tax=Frondihabitans australicus TaxID=386892 RepID=A0A495IMY0_9MICO|nr:alpha/beta hydrolase [Frondihabitans australicus]RKR76526.1 pimeloyl-ACP methyl ester carboxylesterase [Frondihabitans australicus]